MLQVPVSMYKRVSDVTKKFNSVRNKAVAYNAISRRLKRQNSRSKYCGS